MMMTKKTPCAAIFAFCAFAALSAQTGFVPANPIVIPTVPPPAMATVPAVSPPTVTAPTVSPSGETNAGTTAANASAPAKTPKGSAGSAGTTAAAPATGASSATDTASTSATALSLLGLGNNNSLLSALNGTGTDDSSANALSSLLGNGTGSTTADSATLSKILALLEKQQANADTAAASAAASGARIPVVSGGELVRFTVNGYNIVPTTLVSSILAKDGSFLLTGDRGSPASSQKIVETFYLLCRKNADGTYRLHADVSQNPVNVNSYMYQLARRSPIKGTLTGDLLVFRINDPDWNLNLVIRIISPSVVKASVR